MIISFRDEAGGTIIKGRALPFEQTPQRNKMITEMKLLEEEGDFPVVQQHVLAPTITSSISGILRHAIRQSLQERRGSLTAGEFSFVREILKSSSEADLIVLAKNLKDEDTFFDPSARRRKWEEQEPPSGEQEPDRSRQESDESSTTTELHHGSEKRKMQVEKRKSCNAQTQLWRQAFLEVTAANRFKDALLDSMNNNNNTRTSTNGGRYSLGATSSRRSEISIQSTIIPEEAEWEYQREQLQEDMEQDSKWYQNNKYYDHAEDDERSEDKPDHLHKGLITKRASENLYNGMGFEIGALELFDIYSTPQYDPWDEETDRSTGRAFDFKILGTSHHDQSAQPHVLSPPLMHALQSSLPLQQRGESFWLKYSLVRDGASATTFLQNLRGSTNTLMAMETIDGEVFGAFTSSAWAIQPSYYGGGNTFLWRMKHSRAEIADSVSEQAKKETELDVFHNTLKNPFAQVCRHDKIAIGGGTPTCPQTVATGVTFEADQFGFGIALGGNYLIEATSEACLTFNSPPLSDIHSDGSKFELVNLEVWALTPCITLEEARRMEYHRLFLKRHATL